MGIPTVPAVLLPISPNLQGTDISQRCGVMCVGVGIPTPTIAVSPSVLSPSFPLVEGDGVGLPTPPDS